MRLHLKNARLVDGTGRPPRDGVDLVIEGDTLVHAGPLSAADAPRDDASALDLGIRMCPGGDVSILQDRRRLSVMKGGRFVTRNL